jgi:fructose-1,6-bisphosphatase
LATTLSAYLAAQVPDRDLAGAIAAAAAATVEISALVRTAPLAGLTGVVGTSNVQGEAQKPLDLASNDIFLRNLRGVGAISWAVSEEVDEAIAVNAGGTLGVLFDPLDGSSNLDVNVTVGSIFSIIPATSKDHLLLPGSAQLAAGFAAYGPATSLVVAVAGRVSLFVLSDGQFLLAQDEIRIPTGHREYAINSSRVHLWDEGVRRYVTESHSHPERYNMRWVGSMVAEVQRILNRGGVFLYPADAETRHKGGRLRLLYEANPMTYIMRLAGGAGSDGVGDLLEIVPESIHQRVGVVLGDASEVARLEEYVRTHS